MGLNVMNYALQKSGDASVATGVQDVSFNDSGDIVVELRDGSTVSRPLKDISKVENVDGDLVITYSDGTTYNAGALPKGDKGEDGVSPTATVTKSGTTSTITIVDATGTTTAEVNDGKDVKVTDVIYKGTTPPPTGSSYTMWIDTNPQ